MSICSHRSPDGGSFPGDVHRLAAGGYGRAVFLVASTAWQRVATGGGLREGGYAGGYGRAVRVGERRANAEGCFLWLDQQDVGDV